MALKLWPIEALGLGQAGIDRDVVGLVDGAQDVRDAALDRGRRDAVLGVVGELLLAAPLVSAMARSIEPVTWSA